MRKFAFGLAAVAALSITTPASAANLIINGSGQLTGATGVVVNGSTYDVSFVDGTCAGLFSGCDSASDFDFTTFSGAVSASQALLDQVFVDGGSGQFDTDPSLTFGCGDPDNCYATIPYDVFNGGFYANEAWNRSTTDFSNVSLTGLVNFDLTGLNDHVFARFTYVGTAGSVPEPSSWAMMLLGFGAIAIAMRRRRRIQALT
jgi:hypothetical protein